MSSPHSPVTMAMPATRARWENGAVSRFTVIALVAFLTVVDLFAAQAILPALAKHYAVMPAAMGLAVNASTLGMAVAGLAVAVFSRSFEQRSGIVLSLLLLAVPTTLLAYAPNLEVFAALRIVQGLLMATAFTLTLGYLGDRYCADTAASAFAAYVTGNVASNLIGRLVAAGIVDHAGLAANFFVFAGLNAAGAALVYACLDKVPRPIRTAQTNNDNRLASVAQHLADPSLRAAFGIGFCILFAFIGTFTYVGFELTRPPLSLGMMKLGVVYLVFLPSILTTPLAGRAVGRWGTRLTICLSLGLAALGLPLLLSGNLPLVLAGMVLVAVGTFFAQAAATGYVGRAASGNRAAASGLYLASYFLGGLTGSAVIGQLYDVFGWPAAVAGIGVALIIAAGLATQLRALPISTTKPA